jgi:hypothetical protein
MRRLMRQRMTVMLLAGVLAGATMAQATPYEELSSGKRALATGKAVAVNALPGASALVEPKCIQGYVLCKLTFALFSVVAAGESLAMSGGADRAQPRAILYRGFSGNWAVTPRDMAGETKPELLPEAPPPAEGEKKSGDFVPPPL